MTGSATAPTRVLFHYDAGPQLVHRLAALAERGLQVSCCPEGDDERLLEALADAEVVWHVLQPLRAREIAAAPKLRLIQKIGVGVNTIDLDAARARDIAVCNMPGTNSRAVAEMTLLLMLAALRRIPVLDRSCRSGAWFLDAADKAGLGELSGRVVGLVGFGGVPTLLAPILDAMGAQVLYTAQQRKPVPYEYTDLDSLLQRADIVSLHLPLHDATEGLIDARRLAAMRRGAILVNTARGGLVDESALIAALQSGHLAAAGLDVFAEEPVAADNPLLAMDRVVVAPHVAWLTDQTLERSVEVAVRNSLAIRNGSELQHRVI